MSARMLPPAITVAKRLAVLFIAVAAWSHVIVIAARTSLFSQLAAKCSPLSNVSQMRQLLAKLNSPILVVVGESDFVARIKRLAPEGPPIAGVSLPPLQLEALAMLLNWQAASHHVAAVVENRPEYWSNLNVEALDASPQLSAQAHHKIFPIREAATLLLALRNFTCSDRDTTVRALSTLLPSDRPEWLSLVLPVEGHRVILWVGDVDAAHVSEAGQLGRFVSGGIPDEELRALLTELQGKAL